MLTCRCNSTEGGDNCIVPFMAHHIEDARNLWDRTPGIGLSDADSPEALTQFLEANARTSFILLSGDTLVGTILGGSDGRRGYIYHLAVDDSLRGLGHGKALLTACLDALASSGIEKVHLFVMGHNELALTFYAHLGWTRRDDLAVFSKDLVESECGASSGGCTC